MARLADRVPDGVDGELFVDTSCIDCDLCRQLAPATFGRTDRYGQSRVCRQPTDDGERHRALIALVTCPTSSIGTTTKLDTSAAVRALPERIADEVYFCGFAAESSYGAASYLIRRPGGNVLVDSPRRSSRLMARLEELGGVAMLWLSHRDDVADHAAYRARFSCERILHADDARGIEVERRITGTTPIALADDLAIVPVPGHTRGSCVLVHGEFAFTGDHVWATDDQDGLEAGRDVCWWSWSEQKRSMARLAEHAFSWVLPGHGRRWHAPSHAAMRAELLRLAA